MSACDGCAVECWECPDEAPVLTEETARAESRGLPYAGADAPLTFAIQVALGRVRIARKRRRHLESNRHRYGDGGLFDNHNPEGQDTAA